MNAYQRVMGLLDGKEIDRLPVAPILMAFAAHYYGKTYRDYYLDYRVLVESYLRSWRDFDFDMVMVISDPFRETEGFGTQFEYPEEGVPVMREHLLKKLEEMVNLKEPDPRTARRMRDRLQAIEYFRREIGSEVPIVGWVEGPFAEAADLRGVQELMLDLMDAPEMVKELLEITLRAGLNFAREQVRAGADLIGIGDAAASLVSPLMYEEVVLPYEQRLIEGIHAAGAKVKLHICGNTTNLLPFMAQTGADIIDLDWMVDLKLAREHFGDKICICGNVDPVAVLLQGRPEEIRRAAYQCIQDAGHPFILSPGCEVPAATPPENLLALCRVPKEITREQIIAS
ncbi:Uroporphyrinogen decarboxylase [Neomoorella glycerini]|uniref:Uroporphyrinogen decarboxylase n=1 Tax=Neomoorella glycerini TaxID=55779 RepID=A0A6I5ZMJ2_9FIRM|nr:uroporphyrinogen decarboxylase family protein [Moorella glycerini]QGP90841.1 Uroporphyrinogen decarboxylase [Moorella glycerini]